MPSHFPSPLLRVGLVSERPARAEPVAHETHASKTRGQERGVWARVMGIVSRDQILALTDQAVVSGASFLTTILIARFAPSGELGLYSMGFSLLVTSLCILESLISTPYTVQQHRPAGTPDERAGGSLAQTGLLSAVVAVLLAATASGISTHGGRPDLAALLWALAAVAPFLLLREFGRRFAFAHLRMVQALMLDTAVAAIQLTALGWLGWTGHMSAVTAYAALGGACAIAGIAWLYVVRTNFAVRIDQSWAATQQSWSLGKWLLGTQLTLAVQSSLVYWLLAWLVGTTATGVFAASMSIALLSNPLILGAGNFLTPKSALAWIEGGGERLRRESIQDALWLGAAMLLFCLGALLVGEDAIHLLYPGKDYLGQGHTVTVLMVAMLLMAVGMPANNALTSIERPRAIFWTALLATAVTVSLVCWLVLTWGLVGAACGILAGNVVRSATRWIAFLSLVPRTGARANSGTTGAALVPAGVLSVLGQLVSDRKPNDWTVEQLAEGVEANIYRVRCRDRHLPLWQTYRSVAIKLYKPWLSPDIKQVRRQFESLSQLHATLDGSTFNGWKISIPAPLHICESPLALVTSMVPGQRLATALECGSLPSDVSRSLPHAIVATMNRLWSKRLFHGDLTLDNILCDVEARRLSFVDAGTRRACSFGDDFSSAWDPPSHDLVHMLYDTAVSGLSTIVSPVACFRKRMFTEAVVRAFVETIGSRERRLSQLEEIRACARLHLMALGRISWSPRDLYQILQRKIGLLRLEKTIGRLQADVGPSTFHCRNLRVRRRNPFRKLDQREPQQSEP
jgi:O-antigen/teichoic acid export membrane protein/tRNA A-37 threonylcarbamoyl transferase component Bud32